MKFNRKINPNNKINQTYITKKRLKEDEIDFITKHEPRNKFLSKLSIAQEGNTLVLFHLIDHGKTIHDLILTQKEKDRKLFFV